MGVDDSSWCRIERGKITNLVAMNRSFFESVPVWSVAVPVGACALLAALWGGSPGWVLLALAVGALVAAVIVAVHHAE